MRCLVTRPGLLLTVARLTRSYLLLPELSALTEGRPRTCDGRAGKPAAGEALAANDMMGRRAGTGEITMGQSFAGATELVGFTPAAPWIKAQVTIR